MNEPWFNVAYFAWIPGTVLGVLAGVWGSLVGVMAPQGKAKAFVVAFGWTILGASALLLVASIAALATGQPYGVWYGLGLPSLIGLGVVGGLMGQVKRAYQMAEQRKMNARDL